MARPYKATEYQDAIGKWHVGEYSDLAHYSNGWWVPARFLGISLEDWVLKLKNEFHATITAFYPTTPCGVSLLLYEWGNYADAHKFLLWLNKQARDHHWTF